MASAIFTARGSQESIRPSCLGGTIVERPEERFRNARELNRGFLLVRHPVPPPHHPHAQRIAPGHVGIVVQVENSAMRAIVFPWLSRCAASRVWPGPDETVRLLPFRFIIE